MTKLEQRTTNTREEVVLRLLQGEDMEAVSREIGLHLDELTHWLEAYQDAGRDALDTIYHDPLTSVRQVTTTPSWSPWTQQKTWLPE